MGDPSISTYFGTPNENVISYLPIIPMGSSSINVSALPNSLVGISQNGVLLGGGFIGISGDEDFEIDNQRGTFVYRWEYKPGSLVYIVYNLNDNNYFSSEDQEWSQSKSNSLFLKFDYFFQP